MGSGVIEALEQGSEVEVDIALRTPRALPAGPVDVRALQAEVAAAQNDVLAGLSAADFRLDRKFSAIPALTGTVTKSGLAKLAAHPAVLRVDLPAPGGAHLGEVVPLVGADQMHTAGYTGDGVVVAVLDSGLDTDHGDLQNDLVGEECFNDCDNATDRQSGPGAAEDDVGHGTHVTGIITSTGTVSPVGVAPDADILAYKVLDATNSFSSLVTNVVAALDDIIANHPEVDLVNMSLGTNALFAGNCDAMFAFNVIAATAIDTLRANGVTTFVSSGNQASGTSMASPACVRNSIAVGATYDQDLGFVEFGVCTDVTSAVDQVTCFANSNSTTDIFAPGCETTSNWLANGTAILCGTSMASPTSAACAALLLEQDPTLTPAQLEARLETSSVSVTDAKNGLSFPRIECFGPEKQPDPGDTDQDGCTDVAENGANAMSGGLRNFNYFWDFFDVWTHPLGQPTVWVRDKVINVPGDIIGTASRFGPGTAQSTADALVAALTPPVSDSGYHAGFDRGPVIGPNNWNRGPADGAINIPDDIIGVAFQFGTNCA